MCTCIDVNIEHHDPDAAPDLISIDKGNSIKLEGVEKDQPGYSYCCIF